MVCLRELGFDVCVSDGRMGAVIGQDASHPEEVYGVSLPGGSLRRMTHHNKWLSGVRLALQEPMRYSARGPRRERFEDLSGATGV